MELYAQAFEEANALDKLEGFASFYGPDFYKLPRNKDHITLQRQDWIVPEELVMQNATIVPLDAGSTLAWKLA